jgi:methanogenic corrinoid protein MtbC1
MQWNEMDCVPLGAEVMLTDGRVYHVAHVYETPDGERHVWNVAWDATGIGDSFRPTHWMPVPRIAGEGGDSLANFVRGSGQSCPGSECDEPDGLSTRPSPAQQFSQAILNGQRQAAVAVVFEMLRAGAAVPDIYVDVIQTALYEVGQLWESAQITVAEEHTATAIAQYVIAQLYPQLPATTRRLGSMVITGVLGEQHQVGANMVADAMDAAGYNVRFLGADLPNSGILRVVESHHADVLGISATMTVNLPGVVRLIKDLQAAPRIRPPRIVLGGAAFRSLDILPAELRGLECIPDLRAAIQLLC